MAPPGAPCGPRSSACARAERQPRSREPVDRRSTVARVTGSCCARDYESFFGRRQAARNARGFRRHGLRGSARDLLELSGDVRGASVLEVGGGVGAIELELLAAGADRATNVELSGEY